MMMIPDPASHRGIPAKKRLPPPQTPRVAVYENVVMTTTTTTSNKDNHNLRQAPYSSVSNQQHNALKPQNSTSSSTSDKEKTDGSTSVSAADGVCAFSRDSANCPTSSSQITSNRRPSATESVASNSSTITRGSAASSNATVTSAVIDRTEQVVITGPSSVTTVSSEAVIRLREKRPTEVVKVIYDYDPQRGDELNLKRGSRIEVSKGWLLPWTWDWNLGSTLESFPSLVVILTALKIAFLSFWVRTRSDPTDIQNIFWTPIFDISGLT